MKKFSLDEVISLWRSGDWEKLTAIDINIYEHDPDRAKIALFIAVGYYHFLDNDKVRYYINIAKKWGCSDKLIARVLVSGLYNTIGSANNSNGNMLKAIRYYGSAIEIVSSRKKNMSKKMRVNFQINKLDMMYIFKFENNKETKNNSRN
jgi:hypothetical protein